MTGGRRLDFYVGSRWLSGAATFLIVAVLLFFLLSALEDIQEDAERLMVELTVRRLRTELQTAMALTLIRGRQGDIAAWVGANPVDWLGAPPTGYTGDCRALGAHNMAAGSWCFDRERHQLLFRPNSGRWLKMEMAGAEKILRWRLVASPATVASEGVLDLHLELVTPYRWRVE